MREDIKEKFVAALRSGKYTQITNQLANPEGYCAGGVLCDLHRKASDNYWYQIDEDNDWYYLGECETIPSIVRTWAEIDDQTVELLEDLNDSGSTFDQLATYIEDRF